MKEKLIEIISYDIVNPDDDINFAITCDCIEKYAKPPDPPILPGK